MDKTYHQDCFVCNDCSGKLLGSTFYTVNDNPTCDKCFEKTLDTCAGCGNPVKDKVLKALGQSWHPNCFGCGSCKKSLEGVQFTVDSNNIPHCMQCYRDKFAPRCAGCSKPIAADDGGEMPNRIVAMDRNYHVDCYKCEDCGLKLSSKIAGQECYPLDGHLLCKTCNGNRVRSQSAN